MWWWWGLEEEGGGWEGDGVKVRLWAKATHINMGTISEVCSARNVGVGVQKNSTCLNISLMIQMLDVLGQ